ncbi:MAG: RsmF rRNA methyltransferase first C-terminal domain-containing protein [Clostridia bacterium]|nr:RsmF rRNA methyltransferase first C-terminal domain-containing protein [Clostridia bacterium]
MNLPTDFINRMKAMLSEDYSAFEKAFFQGLPAKGVRVNTEKCKEIPSFLENAEKVPWCNEGYYADTLNITGNHPYHMAGLLYFQEPSAMSVVSALNLQKGDYILDLCGAPGGKSTQAGIALMGSGLLIANEIVPSRAKILAENVTRMGLKNTIVTNESPEHLAERFPEFFDKIIVDAPCSGEGMFRKEPQAVTAWSINHTLSCSVRQQNIVDSALKMLKKGGRLIYSTCTFAPCENEGICHYILENYPYMHLANTGLDMLSHGDEKYVQSPYDMSKTRRIFPHKNKGEGHFLAVFEKEGKEEKHNMEKPKKPSRELLDGIKLYKEFEKASLNITLEGSFALFGENLYIIPEGISLDKIKAELFGFHLGMCKKGRFEPSYALALALKAEDFKNIADFSPQSETLHQYLLGNVIEGEVKGWCGITCDGYPLGFAKGDGIRLKNHYPKHLRLKN